MQVKIQLSGITFHPAGNLMLRQNNFKCGEKFYELMAELNEITKGADKDPNSKPYYISTTALQIAERTMQQFIKEEKS